MTETKQKIEPQPSNWFRKIVTGSSQMTMTRSIMALAAFATMLAATTSTQGDDRAGTGRLGQLRATRLRCENRSDPLGIDETGDVVIPVKSK